MKELENKKIVKFSCIDRMSEGLSCIESNEKITYRYHSEFYGDHSENMVIGRDNSGKILQIWSTVDLSYMEFEK